MSDDARWSEYEARTRRVSKEDAKPRGEGQGDAEVGPTQPLTLRAFILAALLLLLILAVIGRLVMLETGSRDTVPAAQQVEAADFSRGRILDSLGLLLASDDFTYELYARPVEIRGTAGAAALATDLAAILGWSGLEVRDALSSDQPQIILERDLSLDQCDAINRLNEGNRLWCTPRRVRVHPHGQLASQVLGIVNANEKGISGAEGYYDQLLRSDGTWANDAMPSRPLPIPSSWRVYVPSPAGRDLVLNLNSALQYMVEQRLAEAITEHRAESGTIIVMDPNTGGILALANWPTFDLSRYWEADMATMRDAGVDLSYEPGSVFKLVTMAAALDSGTMTPDTVYDDSGTLEVDGKVIHNAEDQVYGDVTATEALAKSINTVAARMCLAMGSETFYRYVRLFGFGQRTEVDLYYEDKGVVRSWGTKDWNRFNQATNAFGQGISVTPLQMISAVAAIANGGSLLQPQVAGGVIRNGQYYPLERRVLSHPIRPETALALTRMMVYTVDSSSYAGLVSGYRVAGKTGTAEIPTEQGYTSDETITSFVAFLPAADPKIAVLVKLVKPQTSPWAEQVTVPVFQKVAQDAVSILRIEQNDEMP